MSCKYTRSSCCGSVESISEEQEIHNFSLDDADALIAEAKDTEQKEGDRKAEDTVEEVEQKSITEEIDPSSRRSRSASGLPALVRTPESLHPHHSPRSSFSSVLAQKEEKVKDTAPSGGGREPLHEAAVRTKHLQGQEEHDGLEPFSLHVETTPGDVDNHEAAAEAEKEEGSPYHFPGTGRPPLQLSPFSGDAQRKEPEEEPVAQTFPSFRTPHAREEKPQMREGAHVGETLRLNCTSSVVLSYPSSPSVKGVRPSERPPIPPLPPAVSSKAVSDDNVPFPSVLPIGKSRSERSGGGEGSGVGSRNSDPGSFGGHFLQCGSDSDVKPSAWFLPPADNPLLCCGCREATEGDVIVQDKGENVPAAATTAETAAQDRAVRLSRLESETELGHGLPPPPCSSSPPPLTSFGVAATGGRNSPHPHQSNPKNPKPGYPPLTVPSPPLSTAAFPHKSPSSSPLVCLGSSSGVLWRPQSSLPGRERSGGGVEAPTLLYSPSSSSLGGGGMPPRFGSINSHHHKVSSSTGEQHHPSSSSCSYAELRRRRAQHNNYHSKKPGFLGITLAVHPTSPFGIGTTPASGVPGGGDGTTLIATHPHPYFSSGGTHSSNPGFSLADFAFTTSPVRSPQGGTSAADFASLVEPTSASVSPGDLEGAERSLSFQTLAELSVSLGTTVREAVYPGVRELFPHLPEDFLLGKERLAVGISGGLLEAEAALDYKLLGEGQFGPVYEGRLYPPPHTATTGGTAGVVKQVSSPWRSPPPPPLAPPRIHHHHTEGSTSLSSGLGGHAGENHNKTKYQTSRSKVPQGVVQGGSQPSSCALCRSDSMGVLHQSAHRLETSSTPPSLASPSPNNLMTSMQVGGPVPVPWVSPSASRTMIYQQPLHRENRVFYHSGLTPFRSLPQCLVLPFSSGGTMASNTFHNLQAKSLLSAFNTMNATTTAPLKYHHSRQSSPAQSQAPPPHPSHHHCHTNYYYYYSYYDAVEGGHNEEGGGAAGSGREWEGSSPPLTPAAPPHVAADNALHLPAGGSFWPPPTQSSTALPHCTTVGGADTGAEDHAVSGWPAADGGEASWIQQNPFPGRTHAVGRLWCPVPLSLNTWMSIPMSTGRSVGGGREGPPVEASRREEWTQRTESPPEVSESISLTASQPTTGQRLRPPPSSSSEARRFAHTHYDAHHSSPSHSHGGSPRTSRRASGTGCHDCSSPPTQDTPPHASSSPHNADHALEGNTTARLKRFGTSIQGTREPSPSSLHAFPPLPLRECQPDSVASSPTWHCGGTPSRHPISHEESPCQSTAHTAAPLGPHAEPHTLPPHQGQQKEPEECRFPHTATASLSSAVGGEGGKTEGISTRRPSRVGRASFSVDESSTPPREQNHPSIETPPGALREAAERMKAPRKMRRRSLRMPTPGSGGPGVEERQPPRVPLTGVQEECTRAAETTASPTVVPSQGDAHHRSGGTGQRELSTPFRVVGQTAAKLLAASSVSSEAGRTSLSSPPPMPAFSSPNTPFIISFQSRHQSNEGGSPVEREFTIEQQQQQRRHHPPNDHTDAVENPPPPSSLKRKHSVDQQAAHSASRDVAREGPLQLTVEDEGGNQSVWNKSSQQLTKPQCTGLPISLGTESAPTTMHPLSPVAASSPRYPQRKSGASESRAAATVQQPQPPVNSLSRERKASLTSALLCYRPKEGSQEEPRQRHVGGSSYPQPPFLGSRGNERASEPLREETSAVVERGIHKVEGLRRPATAAPEEDGAAASSVGADDRSGSAADARTEGIRCFSRGSSQEDEVSTVADLFRSALHHSTLAKTSGLIGEEGFSVGNESPTLQRSRSIRPLESTEGSHIHNNSGVVAELGGVGPFSYSRFLSCQQSHANVVDENQHQQQQLPPSPNGNQGSGRRHHYTKAPSQKQPPLLLPVSLFKEETTPQSQQYHTLVEGPGTSTPAPTSFYSPIERKPTLQQGGFLHCIAPPSDSAAGGSTSTVSSWKGTGASTTAHRIGVPTGKRHRFAASLVISPTTPPHHYHQFNRHPPPQQANAGTSAAWAEEAGSITVAPHPLRRRGSCPIPPPALPCSWDAATGTQDLPSTPSGGCTYSNLLSPVQWGSPGGARDDYGFPGTASLEEPDAVAWWGTPSTPHPMSQRLLHGPVPHRVEELDEDHTGGGTTTGQHSTTIIGTEEGSFFTTTAAAASTGTLPQNYFMAHTGQVPSVPGGSMLQRRLGDEDEEDKTPGRVRLRTFSYASLNKQQWQQHPPHRPSEDEATSPIEDDRTSSYACSEMPSSLFLNTTVAGGRIVLSPTQQQHLSSSTNQHVFPPAPARRPSLKTPLSSRAPPASFKGGPLGRSSRRSSMGDSARGIPLPSSQSLQLPLGVAPRSCLMMAASPNEPLPRRGSLPFPLEVTHPEPDSHAGSPLLPPPPLRPRAGTISFSSSPAVTAEPSQNSFEERVPDTQGASTGVDGVAGWGAEENARSPTPSFHPSESSPVRIQPLPQPSPFSLALGEAGRPRTPSTRHTREETLAAPHPSMVNTIVPLEDVASSSVAGPPAHMMATPASNNNNPHLISNDNTSVSLPSASPSSSIKAFGGGGDRFEAASTEIEQRQEAAEGGAGRSASPAHPPSFSPFRSTPELAGGCLPFRSVAVKVFTKMDLDDFQRSTALHNEVLMGSRLLHSSLVNWLGVAEDISDIFLVMDVLPCGTLEKMLQELHAKPVERWRRAPRLMADIVLALEYLQDGSQHPYDPCCKFSSAGGRNAMTPHLHARSNTSLGFSYLTPTLSGQLPPSDLWKDAKGVGRLRASSHSVTLQLTPTSTGESRGGEAAATERRTSSPAPAGPYSRPFLESEGGVEATPEELVEGRETATPLDASLQREQQRERDGVVLHRDIKPSNFMLTSDGHLKLGDFGSACFLGDVEANNFGGTYAYMSGEMIVKGKAGRYSDLWAAGCMLYEMLEGHPPFQGSTGYLITSKIKRFQAGSLTFTSAEEARRNTAASVLWWSQQQSEYPPPQLVTVTVGQSVSPTGCQDQEVEAEGVENNKHLNRPGETRHNPSNPAPSQHSDPMTVGRTSIQPAAHVTLGVFPPSQEAHDEGPPPTTAEEGEVVSGSELTEGGHRTPLTIPKPPPVSQMHSNSPPCHEAVFPSVQRFTADERYAVQPLLSSSIATSSFPSSSPPSPVLRGTGSLPGLEEHLRMSHAAEVPASAATAAVPLPPMVVHPVDAAMDLVAELLQPEPTQRLGAEERGGFAALKAHPFFAGIDWEHLHERNNWLYWANLASVESMASHDDEEDAPQAALSPHPHTGSPAHLSSGGCRIRLPLMPLPDLSSLLYTTPARRSSSSSSRSSSRSSNFLMLHQAPASAMQWTRGEEELNETGWMLLRHNSGGAVPEGVLELTSAGTALRSPTTEKLTSGLPFIVAPLSPSSSGMHHHRETHRNPPHETTTPRPPPRSRSTPSLPLLPREEVVFYSLVEVLQDVRFPSSPVLLLLTTFPQLFFVDWATREILYVLRLRPQPPLLAETPKKLRQRKRRPSSKQIRREHHQPNIETKRNSSTRRRLREARGAEKSSAKRPSQCSAPPSDDEDERLPFMVGDCKHVCVETMPPLTMSETRPPPQQPQQGCAMTSTALPSPQPQDESRTARASHHCPAAQWCDWMAREEEELQRRLLMVLHVFDAKPWKEGCRGATALSEAEEEEQEGRDLGDDVCWSRRRSSSASRRSWSLSSSSPVSNDAYSRERSEDTPLTDASTRDTHHCSRRNSGLFPASASQPMLMREEQAIRCRDVCGQASLWAAQIAKAVCNGKENVFSTASF